MPESTKFRSKYLLTIGFFTFTALLFFCSKFPRQQMPEIGWPTVTQVHKPWTYWWWMGSAVDKQNLTRTLEAYQQAGMGGVHIIPIYGVKGYEDRYLDYLSPQWLEMLAYTTREAKRLDLGVDLSTGTGWPFGGPQVSPTDAATRAILKCDTLVAGTQPADTLQGKVELLLALSDTGDKIDLTDRVDDNGIINWIAPEGTWQLFSISYTGTGQQVKRAAPGGEGNVVNPFSDSALHNYLLRFDSAFASYRGEKIRSFYNDSYEIYGANWTHHFFQEFASRRGYDLRHQAPLFFGAGVPDSVARVKCDYRETIAELLLEKYTIPWVKWCHKKGSSTRNQAHGSPGNLLDLYAAADIPEIEIFGPSGFDIPGLRLDLDFPGHRSRPEPLMLKFASSAAHVTGNNLVSSESCTWLGEHFKVALSQVKPEIDQLLVSGVNHVFYHGMTYSPFEEPWPGWLFYASTNFGPTNSFWRHIGELNAYIARCQSVLQSGVSANDILLYFPIYDWWHRAEGLLDQFDVHSIDKWLHGSNFHKVAKTLWERGYTFDYISDRLLENVKVSKNKLSTGTTRYGVLVVPECHFIPVQTLKKILKLASAGATVIFHSNLPRDVPGYGDLANRQNQLNQVLNTLTFQETGHSGIRQITIGSGRIYVGPAIENLLNLANISREPVADQGIRFIRRTHATGHHYFLTNLSDRELDGWIPLGVKAKSIVILDPLTSTSGLAALRQTETGQAQVYLQLRPGESCLLRVFSSKNIQAPDWQYLQPGADGIEINGNWQVTFIDGAPSLPANFAMDSLRSWTTSSDTNARSFSGTASYRIEFAKPGGNADNWILDLGRVCESAGVTINGRQVGVLWSLPFRLPVGDYLRDGKNVLEVAVTNLSANRIADLDRRQVPWKKFHNINFVNIQYRPFDASQWQPMDSGLLGPVRLVPASKMDL